MQREREGAGWAEEGRRGVGGLVERGSGAVWRYAGCLCGLSRGLIRYDFPHSCDNTTVQIWPSFQLNVKSPPVGGLLISERTSADSGPACGAASAKAEEMMALKRGRSSVEAAMAALHLHDHVFWRSA